MKIKPLLVGLALSERPPHNLLRIIILVSRWLFEYSRRTGTNSTMYELNEDESSNFTHSILFSDKAAFLA